MPTYIVKPDRDDDFYVFYSTIVDAPTRWGTRRQLVANPGGNDVSDERFDRTDRTGSSATWPDWPADQQPYIYSDKEFTIMNGPGSDVEDGYAEVARTDLRAYCEAMGRGDDDAAAALCATRKWE